MVFFHRRKSFWSLSLASILLMSFCACSTPKRKLEIKSDPMGADIANRAGEKIGKTPFVLEGDAIAKVEQDGLAFLNLQMPGYEDKSVILEPKTETSMTVKLAKQESEYFKNKTLRDFSPEANRMVRDLLRIQGLVLMKNVEEAQRSLEDFQKQYPYIAATFVMLANVSLMKRDVPSARNYLLRAKTIDPLDPVILRMLKSLEGAS